jgi:hypothetical protein
MSTTAELLGYINSSGGPAGFVLPVFIDAGGTYIQQADEAGKLKQFIPVEVYEDELIPAPERITMDVGRPLLYAFMLPTGHILAAERERVQDYLAKNSGMLRCAPFARLDALLFAGSLSDAKAAVGSARNRAATENHALADKWAAAELEYLQEKTANISEPLGAKPVLLVFSEGYLSWPELRRQLAWAAARDFDVSLRLRLVRACHSSRTAELVKTFGLNPERLNRETSFIRINSGSYRRLQEIGHLVMVVEATIKLDQLVKVRAIDTNRLRMRYFKRDERKRTRVEFVPDYRYEASA